MGTMFQITLYAPDKAAAGEAAKSAFTRIASLDGIMSDYRSSSELMQLCRKAGGPPVPVGPELFFVLKKAQQVSRLSHGAFDVTVGPVVHLWRLARKIHELPNPKELAAARELVGFDKVLLDEKKTTVRLLKAGMKLDLGGIAKGYAADEALAVLGKHGVASSLVAAGGDIAVSDAPPGEPGWTIGIAPLDNPNQKPSLYLVLHNAAVSTSGDFEQHIDIGGKRYSHIVDPHTGIGLQGRMSATVVARRGIDADSLTKMVAVLGKPGIAIIDNIDGVAALLIRQKDDQRETIESKRFGDIPRSTRPGLPNQSVGNAVGLAKS